MSIGRDGEGKAIADEEEGGKDDPRPRPTPPPPPPPLLLLLMLFVPWVVMLMVCCVLTLVLERTTSYAAVQTFARDPIPTADDVGVAVVAVVAPADELLLL